MVMMEVPQLPWDEAFRAVSGGSTVELVVKLANYRNEKVADVTVGGSGHMVSKGPIELINNCYNFFVK